MAIQSFRDDRVRLLLEGRFPGKGFPNQLARAAARKIEQLDAALTLEDLRSPAGNRLEGLKGDLAGRFSMRINAQFRLVFVWTPAGPAEVEIIDYH